jgi:hypothetical protein
MPANGSFWGFVITCIYSGLMLWWIAAHTDHRTKSQIINDHTIDCMMKDRKRKEGL